MLAGPRRLHRGVQRQNIGLKGDPFDGPDNLLNALGARFDQPHGVHHPCHRVAAAGRHAAGIAGQPVGLVRVLVVVFHGGGELFHAGGGFHQRRGQLFKTGGKIGVAPCGFHRRFLNPFAAGAHLPDDGGQAALHARQAGVEAPDIVVAAWRNRLGQVAVGDLVQVADHVAQGPDHVHRDPPQHRRDHQQRGEHRRHHGGVQPLHAAVETRHQRIGGGP